MPKLIVFVVSAAKCLLKEKRFLLAAVGVSSVFTLFTAPLFSTIAFTHRGEEQFIQQAFAQEESTSTLPFSPFSLQQDQEAVPEEEGGQQQLGTATNQTTSNATNGTAAAGGGAEAASEPPLGVLSSGPSLPQCISISGIEYCLTPPNAQILPGVVCADVHFTNGTSGLYCPSQSAGEIGGETGTSTTPADQTGVGEAPSERTSLTNQTTTTNGTTTANATAVSKEAVCEPVPQQSFLLSQRNLDDANATAADTDGTNNYNMTTDSSLTTLNQNISNRIDQFEMSGFNIIAKEQEDLIGSLVQRKENLIQLMNENPDAAFSFILNPEQQNTLNQLTTNCVERLVTVEGQFSILHADNFEQGFSVNEYHLITTNSGEDITIHPAHESIEDELPQPGSVVRITGFQIDDHLLFDAATSSSSSLTNSENTITGFQVLEEPIFAKVEGDQKILVILFSFNNTPTPNITVDKLRHIVFDQVANYFHQVSYGKISISGDVVGPYKLDSSPNPCPKPYPDHQAAATAADNDVDFREYDTVVLVAPYNNCISGGDAIIGGGPQILTTRYGEVTMKFARINSQVHASELAHVISHELGHVFGMYHADSADCGNKVLAAEFRSKNSGCTLNDYGDPYDRMGGDGHFNAPHKEFLRWFAPSNIKTLETSEYYRLRAGFIYTYQLEPLETATNGLKVLKIPRGGGDFLYVEFRQPIGIDAAFITYKTPLNNPNGAQSDTYKGATLHVLGSTGRQNAHTYIIDPTPDGSTRWPDGTHPFFQSVLPIGGTFTDPLTGITVEVVSIKDLESCKPITDKIKDLEYRRNGLLQGAIHGVTGNLAKIKQIDNEISVLKTQFDKCAADLFLNIKIYYRKVVAPNTEEPPPPGGGGGGAVGPSDPTKEEP